MLSRLNSVLLAVSTALLALAPAARAANALPVVTEVEWQPFAAQVRRVIEATDYLGSPFSDADKAALDAALKSADTTAATERIQNILDRHALFGVSINPEMRVKVAQGAAKAELVENGWRQFLVKVQNESGTTAALRAVSANAQRLFNSPKEEVANRWLDLQMFDGQPMRPTLGGLKVEYRIVQLYSRDAGKREAKMSFNVGQGTQDIGFRNEADVLFDCQPAREITFNVKDENGKPTTASFIIRDAQGRTYPSQAKRLAPDFAFHPQVYRADGETVKLPDGAYTIEFQRGPESVPMKRKMIVTPTLKAATFKVERWVDPAKLGWWSGDHHIHAAGCAHYTNPTEGVLATDMMRHVLGEDLKVGCNLTWGPCFDYQKQFFTGKDDKVSTFPYVLHYDVEVSGFGSHQSGHLCLLLLKEEIYPGGESKNHWPTLGLNTLRWAKKQGAVVGPAHSGWGLETRLGARDAAPLNSKTSGAAGGMSSELPTFIMPPFNGIGANEYIMDVTHKVPGPKGDLVPAVDFMSMVDTPYVWELNIWYHTLNVGFRTRISGETDFPCIYGERVGLGRSYVKLPPKWTYDDWCEGIRAGRNYVSDGKSHIMDFYVVLPGEQRGNTFYGPSFPIRVGEGGSEAKLGKAGTREFLGGEFAQGAASEAKLSKAGPIHVFAKVAARLNEQPDPSLRDRPYQQKPYWDIERARLGDSREVPVELIVNGQVVAKQNITADGTTRDVKFDAKIDRSSWVALRILPSSHTNPIWVMVGDQPVRASKRSAEWCLKSVDQCWSQKERTYRAEEKEQAAKDYDHARQVYRQLVSECLVD
ncbi:MAG: CehA/McbA family metallohydrolase [Verrucomicrobia bacterium]|nr:CehA/McbA family metallohydrolase [Verrucomicrobiota bacterium]